MQIARLVQAVILMTIVALAASCAASKEYTSKLFNPRVPAIKDSQAMALKFLDLENAEIDKENWVTTDIITGKDTTSQTLALDKLSQTLPANAPLVKKDTVTKTTPVTGEAVAKTTPAVKEVALKITPGSGEPVAKSTIVNGVRTKKTRDEK